MTLHPRLIAIGGGGFTHEADPCMEDYLLAQLPMVRPRIGFVGTASRDDPVKIARFHARFASICASHTHLPMQAGAAEAQAWVDGLDIVYVGGGNTLHLVAHWRRQGIDQVMVAAALRGVLMAGVSAGANVWFAQALSDSGGKGLVPAEGIGLIPGSCCPHYSSEPQRRPAYMARIAQGALPDGIAIDDGAAVLIDGAGNAQVFSARTGAGACRVRRHGESAVCQPIAAAIRP
jgi:peptidase E